MKKLFIAIMTGAVILLTGCQQTSGQITTPQITNTPTEKTTQAGTGTPSSAPSESVFAPSDSAASGNTGTSSPSDTASPSAPPSESASPLPVNKETIVPRAMLTIGPWYPEKQPEEGYDMPYAIEVDVTNQCVNIYIKNEQTGLYDIIINRFVCSTGLKATPTPLGTFKMNRSGRAKLKDEWKYFKKWNSWAQYATRIDGPYLFHSFSFLTKNANNPSMYSYNNLGSRASAGCVRLLVEHAKWIYDNVEEFTFVNITQGKKADINLKYALKIPKYGQPVSEDSMQTPPPSPTPTPSLTPTPVPTQTPSPTVTMTPDSTPTITPSVTQTQTQTAEPPSPSAASPTIQPSGSPDASGSFSPPVSSGPYE